MNGKHFDSIVIEWEEPLTHSRLIELTRRYVVGGQQDTLRRFGLSSFTREELRVDPVEERESILS